MPQLLRLSAVVTILVNNFPMAFFVRLATVSKNIVKFPDRQHKRVENVNRAGGPRDNLSANN